MNDDTVRPPCARRRPLCDDTTLIGYARALHAAELRLTVWAYADPESFAELLCQFLWLHARAWRMRIPASAWPSTSTR